jgi:hypothetical protein
MVQLITYPELGAQPTSPTGNELIALWDATGPLRTITLSQLAGLVEFGGQTPISSDYVVSAADIGSTLLVDDVAGDVAITLPPVADFGPGNALTVQINRVSGVAQGAGLLQTFINCDPADRFGADEPLFNVTGVENGSGLIRVRVQEQRLWSISNGFANVEIEGAGGGANGIWAANRPLVEALGFTAIDLVGSTFSTTAGAGGTARLLRTQLVLKHATSFVRLVASVDDNGVGRWLYQGSLDIAGRSDMGFGDNTASSPLGYAGFNQGGSLLPIVDAAYNAAGLRWGSRSFLATEYADPPELGFGRYTGADGVGVYPDGPNYTTGTAGEVLGTIWFMGSVSGNGLIGRSTQIYSRLTEVPSLTQRGGSFGIDTVTGGTNTMVNRATFREQISFGTRLGNGFVEVNDDSTTIPTLWVRNSSATPATVIRGISGGSGNNTRSFLTFESNGGLDLEFRFSETGNGTCDGAWTGGGADYAEFFEWWDGNPTNEDRVGKSVVLVSGLDWETPVSSGEMGDHEETRIRLADSLPGVNPARIIGAVSATPLVGGGGGELRWVGKYENDDFGRPRTETAEHVSWSVYSIQATNRQPDRAPHYSVSVKTEVSCFVDRLNVPVPAFHGESLDEAVERFSQRYADIKGRFLDGGEVSAEERVELKALASFEWTSSPIETMASRRVLNPAFDERREYIPRSQRSEWDYIALLGQAPLIDGQPCNPNWIVLRKRNNIRTVLIR